MVTIVCVNFVCVLCSAAGLPQVDGSDFFASMVSDVAPRPAMLEVHSGRKHAGPGVAVRWLAVAQLSSHVAARAVRQSIRVLREHGLKTGVLTNNFKYDAPPSSSVQSRLFGT